MVGTAVLELVFFKEKGNFSCLIKILREIVIRIAKETICIYVVKAKVIFSK